MKFFEESRYRKIHVLLLGLIAFTLPFPIILNSTLIILCIALLIFQGCLIKAVQNASKNLYVILLWLLFLLYIISIFFSKNQHEGFAILERKASFIILPLLIFAFPVSTSEIKKICELFVLGVLLAFIICIGYAFYQVLFNSRELELFFYQKLTTVLNMNAVYMASYCIIALHIALYFSKEYHKVLVLIVSVLLIIFCVLLNSKMMLVCLCLGLIIFAFKKLSRLKALLTSSIILAGMFFIGVGVPKVKERITLEVNSNMSVIKQDTFRYDTPFTGTSLRLVFWRFSKEIIKENNGWLIGVHTGDFQHLLNEKYKRTGIYTGNSELKDTGYLGYGPHNQYIEVLLSLGIIGLIIFLMLLILYLKKAWVTNNYLALQCILVFIFFFITESVLSVNKGVVVFLFFTLLFYNINTHSKHSENK
jgi:O-antigen ligase